MGRLHSNNMKRNSLDIIASILEKLEVDGETRLTRISYYARLPYPKVKKYIELLVEKGLVNIVHENGTKYYRISRKGLEYLNHYRVLMELIT